MDAKGIITLLTDFGDRDVYVGVMKGVMAQIAPSARTIDLTHQIPPQNLEAARFALSNAYPYFPPDTVHVAVVDPGVGSIRRGVAIKFSRGLVVCPDNGICSGIIELDSPIAAVELTNTEYWRVPNPSNTFHGRDIFAPVGAHLANGVSLNKLGRAIDPQSLMRLSLPPIIADEEKIEGCIQYIDRFGNLVTNIPEDLVRDKSWQMTIDKIEISSGSTYSDVATGQAITIIGSHGWVEIAVNGGNAREKFGLIEKDRIRLTINN